MLGGCCLRKKVFVYLWHVTIPCAVINCEIKWLFYGVETCSLRLPIADQSKHDALQEVADYKSTLHIGVHSESPLTTVLSRTMVLSVRI